MCSDKCSRLQLQGGANQQQQQQQQSQQPPPPPPPRHPSFGPSSPMPNVAEIFAMQFFNRNLGEDLMSDHRDGRLKIVDRLAEKRLSVGVITVGSTPKMSAGLKPPSTGKPRRNSFTLLFPGSKDSDNGEDNREKLADYLKQCECSMPKHGNDQLAEIDADLQATWNQPLSDKISSTSKAVRQQSAIWELFQTELNILRHLKTIIEIYVAVIHYLQSNANLLLDVSTDKLFPNVSEVFGAHYTLWKRHLRPALLRARTGGCPVRPRDFEQGFTEFQAIFGPSMDFCLRITECKDYLRLQEKNEAFNDFVKWAQKFSSKNYNTEDGSMDLQLKSLLTTPFQRLTKYGLLLQEILKHTEDSEDREALDQMIRHVTDFCTRVNSRYQEKADEEEVRSVSDRLEDAKLSEQMDSLGDECCSYLEKYRLSLAHPMPHNRQPRRKLCEGDFKLKDERGKWSDVKLLLFTDLLLVAKVGGKRQNLRLLRAPVRLDKLALYRQSDTNSFVAAVLTDFGSIESILCLSAADQKQCDDWLERLSQSQAFIKEQLLASSGRPEGGRCENCGYEPVALRPKPLRWISETTPASPTVSPRQRNRATLQEVATQQRQQQPHDNTARSSIDIDRLHRDTQQPQRSPVSQEQQPQYHILVQRHLLQHQQQFHLSQQGQHQRDKSEPAASGRLRMVQEQQRCNSTDEVISTPRSADGSMSVYSVDAAALPQDDLPPERRRTISFIRSSNHAP